MLFALAGALPYAKLIRFHQLIVGDADFAGCFQQPLQFLICLDVSDEWFSVGHVLSPFLSLFLQAWVCNNSDYSNDLNSLPFRAVHYSGSTARTKL
jgi:hypothetical protein